MTTTQSKIEKINEFQDQFKKIDLEKYETETENGIDIAGNVLGADSWVYHPADCDEDEDATIEVLAAYKEKKIIGTGVTYLNGVSNIVCFYFSDK